MFILFKKLRFTFVLLLIGIGGGLLLSSVSSFAQSVPTSAQDISGSADAGRIRIDPESILPRESNEIPSFSDSVLPEQAQVPEGAEDIMFVLQDVSVQGSTVFSEDDLSGIYQDLIGAEIQLSKLWEISQEITALYQSEGYFLSRAYVPAQEIETGNITINVIEGYIGDIEIEGERSDNYLVFDLQNRILSQKPVRLEALERNLLLLNDIPGFYYRAVLEKMPAVDAPEGAVLLILKEAREPGSGAVFLSNHGSPFSGPARANFAYQYSVIPFQKSTIYGMASIPGGNEVWELGLQQEAKILPELTSSLAVDYTVSEPGHTLEQFDIESSTVNINAGVKWNAIRQRRQNLDFGLMFDLKNVNSDIFDTPLTRDRIRVLRADMHYEGADPFIGGYSVADVQLSRGITGLGASNPGDLNLSRTEAKPDFTVINASLQYHKAINSNWLASTTIKAQHASKPLYSSEEFGVGGATLGRAYDESEITGDKGVAGSVELTYTGIKPIEKFKISPSVFYDLGKIWNIDQAQSDSVSISSLGAGVSVSHPSGFNASISIAQPLTKSIDAPIQGNNGHNPRVFFRMGWSF